VGTKATCRVWPGPAFSTAPAAGVYVNVPGSALFLNAAVALSWVPLSAVPYVMSCGFAQVITGVALCTTSVPVAVLCPWYAAFVYVATRAYPASFAGGLISVNTAWPFASSVGGPACAVPSTVREILPAAGP